MRLFALESRRFRFTAFTALISFTVAATGCTASEDVPSEPGVVAIDVRVPGPDGDWLHVMQEQVPADQLPTLSYEYRLDDGTVTLDPQRALAAPAFSVDVTGGKVTFRRSGDRFELVESPAGDPVSGAPPVVAAQLEGSRALFHVGKDDWRQRPADVELTVSSEAQADADRALASLSMTLMLAPHQEQPHIAWAAVVAIVGLGWLAFCGGALAGCRDACVCYSGYRLNCLGFTVSRVDGDWDVSFTGIGCTCVLPKIKGEGCES
jgi:hypothetical protein